MSVRAAGPWLVVIGMHRSGTSAVTGAIAALGFHGVATGDRLSPHDSNPEHWESLSILLHNDAILADLGGTWDAPPDFAPGWEADERLPAKATASELLAAAYPRPGASVWKDPRACLLLPYWRDVLGAPMAAVLVWRSPLAVARSLWRRDGLPIPYGVALWERYNRSALANLTATDVFVLDYDRMIEDPAGSLAGLIAWIRSTGTFEGVALQDRDRALAEISSGLRHESAGGTAETRILLDEQRHLIDYLAASSGGHGSLPPLTGPESPWTGAMIDRGRASSVLELRKAERALEHAKAERDWFASALEDERSRLESVKASSSWRLTAPVRTVAARWSAARRPPVDP
jgi:hypothetical protein